MTKILVIGGAGYIGSHVKVHFLPWDYCNILVGV